MTVYTNKDVFHAEISYARQGVPTGNFILKKDVSEVLPDDEIKIIGNHRHHLWDEITGSKTISTSTFHDANGDFIEGGINKGDYVYITSGTEQGAYKILSVDSAIQITVDFTWTATESALEYWIQKRRTIISGTEGVTTVSTDNFTDGTATFLSDGIVAGDMLIIKGTGGDAGSYIIATVDSETQLSLNDHAGDPVSFSGDTELEYEVGMIIFDAYIEDLDIEEAQGIYAISKAQEILQNKPSFTHYGYSGVMFRKLLYEHTNILQKPSIIASGSYTLRPLTDTHDSTDWSDSSGNNNGDMWDDIDEVSPDSSYIWTETNNAMFSCSLNAVNLPTSYDSEIYKGNIAGRFRKPVTRICNISFSILNGFGWTTPVILAFPFGWGTQNIDDKEFSFSDDNFTPEIKVIFLESSDVPAHIDQLYVTAYYRTYRKDNRIQGSTSIFSISPGQSPIIDIFNLISLTELKTWYLDPLFYLHFNNGDKVSGINLIASDKIGNIHGTRKIKSYDKINLRGGYVNGVQITATAGTGNKIATETYSQITNQTILDNLASQLLTEKGYNQFDITLDYFDPEYGLIQAGETVNIAGGIKFDNVSRTIPANDYNIDSVTLYLSENGVYSHISLKLVDFLVFSMPDEDTTKKNTKSGDDNATALSQVASSGVSIGGGGGAGGGGGEANVGSNVGTDGVGVYDGKTGATLQFRNIAPTSSKLTITLNGKDIDIEAVATEIEKEISLANLLEKSHESLNDVEADQHHARYEDGEAVAAVEAAGLTMANPIDMGNNDIDYVANIQSKHYGDAETATFLDIVGKAGNNDIKIWEVHGSISGIGSGYGFYMFYEGSGSGNLNALQLWSHNKTAANIEVFEVLQNGYFYHKTPLDMGTHKITGLGDPVDAQDAATKAYADAKVSNAVYDPNAWEGVETIAPSKEAVKDAIVPLSNATVYQGTWTPGSGYPADPRSGDFYIVDTDGYQAAVGNTPARWYEIGDWVVYNETLTKWDIIRNTYGDNVISVAPGDDIQVAIDEIEAVGAGVIFLQPGTHTLSATLTINNANVNIVIQGAFDASIIDINGNYNGIYVTNAKSCILRNLKVDASDISDDLHTAINMHEASNNKVITDNLHIIGNGTHGWGISNYSEQCEITSCICEELYNGIYIQGDKSIATQNICKNNSQYGIRIGASHNIITDNIVTGNGDNGIYLVTNFADYNFIGNNLIEDNGDYGIYISLNDDYNVIGINEFYNNVSGEISNNGSNNKIFGDTTDIGVANKRWKNCIYEGSTVFADSLVWFNGAVRNANANDGFMTYGVPLDLVKGSHNLVITQIKVGLQLANGTNYITNRYFHGWSDFETVDTTTQTDNLNTPGEYTWDIADVTVGGVYEKIAIALGTIVANASQLSISYVKVEYYYTA